MSGRLSPGRGECQGCRVRRALRSDGLIRRHYRDGAVCYGSGRLPVVQPIVCTGRALDDQGNTTGSVCGRELKPRYGSIVDPPWPSIRPGETAETAAELLTRARLSGWKVASDVSGHAICPWCARPDPKVVALCRDLERSTR